MICNERQYLVTKAQIRKFELAIAELSSKTPPDDENQKLRHQVHLDALNSQLEEMLEEVEEYENLKEGKIERLQLDDFQQLPEALIKARIVRGLTQEQLADRLGVKPQQVQRDEANKYASASFSKILEVQRALNIDIKEEVIFK
ncbi:MAG: helix-turn-helix domain-containing protein [Cyanosarcina radialis HA8281-LM2]|jgi:ribosome-binding protein aMBF1 (putative translation factor)|nr:helix-turn-helix domain-containing protein [Cyanosarcina radialis HA8281-LM2]